jgi:hypothetical protein
MAENLQPNSHKIFTNHPTIVNEKYLHVPGFVVANAAALAAIVTMVPGDIAYQIDTAVYYKTNGATWVPIGTGGSIDHSILSNLSWVGSGHSGVPESTCSFAPSSNVAISIQNNANASAAPTVNDDTTQGYRRLSKWYDQTNDLTYECLDATTGAALWVETGGLPKYGGMYTYDKAVSLVINTANKYHAYYSVAAGDIVTGLVSGWTFNAGRQFYTNITIILSNGAGTPLARVTCSGNHNLTTNDIVVITNATTAAYNSYTKVTVVNATTFDCQNIPYSVDSNPSSAIVTEPAYLQNTAAVNQVYHLAWSLSGSSALAGKQFKFELVKNITDLDNMAAESTFTNNTVQNVSAQGFLTINAGDRIWIQCKNTSGDTTDFVVKHFNITVMRGR